MTTGSAGTLGVRRWPALALLCMAQFVDVLGVTVVIVALPSIGRDLVLSEAGLQWVASIYALFFGGFLMLSGRAADLYGRRRLFMAGLALFAGASLACGLAGSPALLLAARAAQGLGAAIVVPAALSILTEIFPEGSERDRALGLWTAAAAGGGAFGLFLGGVLTGGLGWEWVFFVNVPVGLAGLVLAPFLLPESRDRAARHRLDLPGAFIITSGLLLLIFGFTRAEEAGFATASTLGVLALAAALLVGFVVLERRVSDPLVPPGAFRSRTLSGSSLIAFILTATTSPFGVILTVYLQRVLDYPPVLAGLVLLPFSLSVVVGSFVGSALVGRAGERIAMLSGLAVIAASVLLSAGISATGGLAYVISGDTLAGLGLGCASVAATSAGVSAVGGDEQGLASGLLNTAAQVGTALGIAALVTVAAARTGVLAGGGDPTDAALVEGFRLAFFAAGGLAAAGCLVALLLVRDRERKGGGPA